MRSSDLGMITPFQLPIVTGDQMMKSNLMHLGLLVAMYGCSAQPQSSKLADTDGGTFVSGQAVRITVGSTEAARLAAITNNFCSFDDMSELSDSVGKNKRSDHYKVDDLQDWSCMPGFIPEQYAFHKPLFQGVSATLGASYAGPAWHAPSPTEWFNVSSDFFVMPVDEFKSISSMQVSATWTFRYSVAAGSPPASVIPQANLSLFCAGGALHYGNNDQDILAYTNELENVPGSHAQPASLTAHSDSGAMMSMSLATVAFDPRVCTGPVLLQVGVAGVTNYQFSDVTMTPLY